MTRRARVAAVALLAAACSDWRDRVTPGLAAAPPEQRELKDAKPTRVAFGERFATLTPRASYRVKAWVAELDRGMDDGAEHVLSLDLALVWGPVANRDVLRDMRFHLKRRYVSVRWKDLPFGQDVVMKSLANHHLVVTDPALAKTLEDVEIGDLVELEGKLVDVALEGEGARLIRTSLVRNDIGNGACEVLWVERAQVTRP